MKTTNKTKSVRVSSRKMKFKVLELLRNCEGFSEEIIWGGRFGDIAEGMNYLIDGEVIATQGTDKGLRILVRENEYVF
jgi:hypothetical protein